MMIRTSPASPPTAARRAHLGRARSLPIHVEDRRMTGDDGRPVAYRIPCCAEDGLSAVEVRELFIEQARQNLRGGYRLRVTRRDEHGPCAVVIEEAP